MSIIQNSDEDMSRRDVLGQMVFGVAAIRSGLPKVSTEQIDVKTLKTRTDHALACTEHVFPEKHSIQFYDYSTPIQLGIELENLDSALRIAGLETGIGFHYCDLMSRYGVSSIYRSPNEHGGTSVKVTGIDGKELKAALTELRERINLL